jgi:SsrA-binding protein
MSKKKDQEPDPMGFKVVAMNKRARFDYYITDVFEAGLVLSGNEIKSIRDGLVTIKESYVKPRAGEMYLIGANISEYSHSSARDYDPARDRKLLLHKREISRLQGRVEMRGFTIVPLRLYLKNGRAKLEIGLAKGKEGPDKRQAVKDRETKLEARRALKNR